MPNVMNGSVKIHYEVSGTGTPLVLIMGLGADHTAWDLHKAAYQDHFQCIAVDNRGVGSSDKPSGPYTTDDMASDMIAVMDDLGIERAHVAGISMGGAIAQTLCLNYPDRISCLVLVSTFAKLPVFHSTVFENFKSMRRHSTPDDFMQCLQLWIWGEAHFESSFPDLIATQEEAALNPAPQPQYAFEAQCDACISHDTAKRLNEIKVPTLITAGSADIFTPVSLSEQLRDGIPSSELVIFEGDAHTHHWEALERFNAQTLDFLRAH